MTLSTPSNFTPSPTRTKIREEWSRHREEIGNYRAGCKRLRKNYKRKSFPDAELRSRFWMWRMIGMNCRGLLTICSSDWRSLNHLTNSTRKWREKWEAGLSLETLSWIMNFNQRTPSSKDWMLKFWSWNQLWEIWDRRISLFLLKRTRSTTCGGKSKSWMRPSTSTIIKYWPWKVR